MVYTLLAARETVAAMWASGADVAKVATTARDITDARRMLAVLEERSGALTGYLHAHLKTNSLQI